MASRFEVTSPLFSTAISGSEIRIRRVMASAAAAQILRRRP
jgi:hypothetical protein